MIDEAGASMMIQDVNELIRLLRYLQGNTSAHYIYNEPIQCI